MSLTRLVSAITAPYRAIDRLYSHDNHQHEIRAAFMDGLDAAVGTVILTLAAQWIINYFGARNPIGVSNMLGYYHTSVDITWSNLLPVAVVGGGGFALSLLAIYASSYKSRPEPKRLPLGRRIFALTAATAVAIIAAMLLDQSSGLGAIVDGVTILLPALVPAAKRLTTKEAFTYPVAPVTNPA
jgi:hypothetical protein